jgi:hypothetical protein
MHRTAILGEVRDMKRLTFLDEMNSESSRKDKQVFFQKAKQSEGQYEQKVEQGH